MKKTIVAFAEQDYVKKIIQLPIKEADFMMVHQKQASELIFLRQNPDHSAVYRLTITIEKVNTVPLLERWRRKLSKIWHIIKG